jgi:ParB/RepB/Spo0J family partition protein
MTLSLLPDEAPKGTLRTVKLIELPSDEELPGVAPTDSFIESVRHFGVIQPVALVVTSDPVLNLRLINYRVAAGRRRIKSARLLGLAEIPALVFEEGANFAEVATLIENAHRKANPASEVEAILALDKRFRDSGCTLSDKDLAETLGLNANLVKNRRRLISLLPKLFKAFLRGDIKPGVAEAAAKLSEAQQEQLIKAAEDHDDGFTVTADMIKHIKEAGSVKAQRSMEGDLFPDSDLDEALEGREVVLTGKLPRDLRTLRHYLASSLKITETVLTGGKGKMSPEIAEVLTFVLGLVDDAVKAIPTAIKGADDLAAAEPEKVEENALADSHSPEPPRVAEGRSILRILTDGKTLFDIAFMTEPELLAAAHKLANVPQDGPPLFWSNDEFGDITETLIGAEKDILSDVRTRAEVALRKVREQASRAIYLLADGSYFIRAEEKNDGEVFDWKPASDDERGFEWVLFHAQGAENPLPASSEAAEQLAAILVSKGWEGAEIARVVLNFADRVEAREEAGKVSIIIDDPATDEEPERETVIAAGEVVKAAQEAGESEPQNFPYFVDYVFDDGLYRVARHAVGKKTDRGLRYKYDVRSVAGMVVEGSETYSKAAAVAEAEALSKKERDL